MSAYVKVSELGLCSPRHGSAARHSATRYKPVHTLKRVQSCTSCRTRVVPLQVRAHLDASCLAFHFSPGRYQAIMQVLAAPPAAPPAASTTAPGAGMLACRCYWLARQTRHECVDCIFCWLCCGADPHASVVTSCLLAACFNSPLILSTHSAITSYSAAHFLFAAVPSTATGGPPSSRPAGASSYKTGPRSKGPGSIGSVEDGAAAVRGVAGRGGHLPEWAADPEHRCKVWTWTWH
jgi:hypothetical protein